MEEFIEARKCRGVTDNSFICIGAEGKQCYPQDSNTVRYSCGRGDTKSHCPVSQPKGAKACCAGEGQIACRVNSGELTEESSYNCISKDRTCCGLSDCSSDESCLDGSVCCSKENVCGNKCMTAGQTCCDGSICQSTSTTTKTTTSGITSASSSSTDNTSGSPTSTRSSSGSVSYSTSGEPTTTGENVPTSFITDNISDIIRTAIPSSAQTDPAAPCFLSATGDSVYTTPDWYTALPTELQSYFSSINAGGSISSYCTAEPTSPGSSHGTPGSALSKGGKVGIALGAAAIAVALGILLFLALKTGLPGRLCALCGIGAATAEDQRRPTIPTTKRLGSGMLRLGDYWTGVSGSSGDSRKKMGGTRGSMPPIHDPPSVPVGGPFIVKGEDNKDIESQHASIMTVSSLETGSGHDLAKMPLPSSGTGSERE